MAKEAWATNMAKLEGQERPDSPEQQALQAQQRWMDKCEAANRAEHTQASPARVAQVPLEARRAELQAMRLQLQEQEAALAKEEEKRAEQAKEEALTQTKLAGQAEQFAREQESDMVVGFASSSSTGIAGKCSSIPGAFAELFAEKARLEEENAKLVKELATKAEPQKSAEDIEEVDAAQKAALEAHAEAAQQKLQHEETTEVAEEMTEVAEEEEPERGLQQAEADDTCQIELEEDKEQQGVQDEISQAKTLHWENEGEDQTTVRPFTE